MKLAPFLLEHWLNEHHFAEPPIEFDIASSTGPQWTLRQVLALAGEEERERLLDAKLVYSDSTGSRALREAIAEMQGVAADEVQIVTGASEALLILFFLAAEPGANVVLPFPVFPTFAALPESLGIEARYYHLRRENDFRIDPDEVRRLTDGRTKAIFVNSPHNPTGATLSDDEAASLHDLAAERNIQFVSDEVYHPIYHGTETRSAARLSSATVLGDFSKSFCLSGLRVGWIVERDKKKMAQYSDARAYFTISNTPLGEDLATVAVRNRETIFAKARESASANLSLLDQFFAEHADTLGWVRPRGGMTAFPWLKDDADASAFCRAAAERGILLVPGAAFRMPSHFRLGFASIGNRFPQALERFSDFVKAYSVRKKHA